MKVFGINSGCVIVGILIGYIISYLVTTLPYMRRAQDMALMNVEADLFALKMIRETNSAELLKRDEDKVRNYPVFLYSRIGLNEQTAYYLRRIYNYCATNNVILNPDALQIINSIPSNMGYPIRTEISDW